MATMRGTRRGWLALACVLAACGRTAARPVAESAPVAPVVAASDVPTTEPHPASPWLGTPVPATPPAAGEASAVSTARDASAQPTAAVPPAATRGAVRVVVRDFAGGPIAGARVVVTPPVPDDTGRFLGITSPLLADWYTTPAAWDLAPLASGVADAEAACTLRGLAAGAARAVVETPGRVRRGVAFDVPESGDAPDVEIRTELGHAFEGRVFTQRGVPVEGATVLARYPAVAPRGRFDWRLEEFARTTTDAGGRFRFDALPAAVVRLSAAPAGTWSSHEWPVLVPSVASLDLRIESRGPLEGVVRVEPDGRPLAGADLLLSVETWHTANVYALAHTDAEGRWRIPVYPGDGVMSIAVIADGVWPRPRVVGERDPPFRLFEEGPTVLELSARPDAREFAAVRGVVRGPDGPVAGARLFLTRDRDEVSDVSDWWSSASVTSDARGRFHFLEAPAGMRLAVVLAEPTPGLYQPGAPTFSEDEAEPVDRRASWWIAADAPRPADVEVALVRGGRVSGRALDERGRPVAGANLFGPGGRRATSAADGTYVVDGLPEPVPLTLSAHSADGRLAGKSESLVAGAGKDADGVDVVLREKPQEGHVLVTGRVVAYGEVLTGDVARIAWGGVWALAEPSGAFRVEVPEAAASAALELAASFGGWAPVTVKVRREAGDSAMDAGEVRAWPGGVIRGKVEGPDGPLAGVLVRIRPRAEGHTIVCDIGEDPQPTIAAVTRSDGTYEVRGVGSGEHELLTSSPGLFDAETRIDVGVADCAADIRLKPRPGRFPIRGRVLRRDGRPVAGVAVWARTRDGVDWSAHLRGRTDENGSFAVEGDLGETYVVVVSPPDEDSSERPFAESRSAEVRRASGPLTIVVEEAASIAGRVLDHEGSPVSGLRVVCSPAGPQPEDSDADDSEDTTDADGGFECDGLPAGEFDVNVELDLESVETLRGVVSGVRGLELRVPTPLATCGVLLDCDGNPVSDQWLVVRPTESEGLEIVRVQTDAEGQFRVRPLRLRSCRIEAGAGAPSVDAMPLVGGANVAPGSEDVVLRVPAAEATRIRGRVVDEKGSPFAECVLRWNTRPNCTIEHTGADFEITNVRLDAPLRFELDCSGTWTFDVPAGTDDLVITAGPNGLRRVEFGGAVRLDVDSR